MKFYFMNIEGVINLEEFWKDIKGYESLYQVSSWGRVKRVNTGRILKGCKNKDAYFYVDLYKNGSCKKYYIHRLVAQAFIPNPQNKPQVNHVDENNQNNRVENLEWCTSKENNNHGTHNLRVGKSNSKSIICVETGVKYHSTKDCAKQLGLNRGNITNVLKGRRKTCGGYTFKYKEE